MFWIVWNPQVYTEKGNGDSLNKIVDFEYFVSANGFEANEIQLVAMLHDKQTALLDNGNIIVRKIGS